MCLTDLAGLGDTLPGYTMLYQVTKFGMIHDIPLLSLLNIFFGSL